MLNQIISHSGTSAADANQIFEKMYHMTMQLFYLKPDVAVCSRGSQKRWKDLASLWTDYANEECEYSVFEIVLHKIYWGVYPDITSDRYSDLLELVENEILSDGPAFKAWKDHAGYKFAFNYIKKQQRALTYNERCSHSYVFDAYLRARFWHKVVYKERKPSPVDPERASMHDLKSAKTHADIYAARVGFEKAICCLIPEAKDWSTSQWLDEYNIDHALYQKYGVRYKAHDGRYEYLITALINKLHYNAPIYLAQMLRVGTMPKKMAQQIWPGKTDVELKKLFLQAASRAKSAETRVKNGVSNHCGAYSYDKLRRSWLYKCVYKDITSKKKLADLDQKVKLVLFEVSLS